MEKLIYSIWKMAQKEKRHLAWLIKKKAPKEMIKGSRENLAHLIKRHKEYKDYMDRGGEI